MVEWMLAWVTAGFMAPEVKVESGKIAEAAPDDEVLYALRKKKIPHQQKIRNARM